MQMIASTEEKQAITFWVIAASHAEAALYLHGKIEARNCVRHPPIHAVLFLFYRSIELALKSYLLKNGMTVGQLKRRKLGHNIAELYAASVTKNISAVLNITAEEHRALVDLSRHYTAKDYEYPKHVWVPNRPRLATLSQLCQKIVNTLK
jgi:hypothetical protein